METYLPVQIAIQENNMQILMQLRPIRLSKSDQVHYSWSSMTLETEIGGNVKFPTDYTVNQRANSKNLSKAYYT